MGKSKGKGIGGIWALDKFGGYSICQAKPGNFGKYGCIHIIAKPDDMTIEAFEASTEEQSKKLARAAAKDNPKIKEAIPSGMAEAAIETLKEKDIALVVAATGTGKSAAIGSILWDLTRDEDGNKVGEGVIVIPNNELEAQFRSHGMNYQYVSYQKLLRWKEGKTELPFSVEDVSAIAFDECHRALAEKWEEACRSFISATGAKVVGLTATPERTADNKAATDMFGKPAYAISVEEAFAKYAYVNTPTYRTPAIEEYVLADLMDLRKRIENNGKIHAKDRKSLVDTIDTILSVAPDVHDEHVRVVKDAIADVVAEKGEDEGLKVVVFTSDMKSLKEVQDEYDAIFAETFGEENVGVCEYVYGINGEDEKKFIKSFTSSEKVPKGKVKLVYCIDKFNEGFHVDDLDIIIKTKKTKSEIVDKQQNGRMLGTREHRGAIVDFAGNIRRSKRSTDWKAIDAITREDPHYGYETLHDESEWIYGMKNKVEIAYAEAKGDPVITDGTDKFTLNSFVETLDYDVDRPRAKVYAKDWVKVKIKDHDAAWLREHAWEINTWYPAYGV